MSSSSASTAAQTSPSNVHPSQHQHTSTNNATSSASTTSTSTSRRPLSNQEFQAATDAVEQEINVVTALKRLSIGNNLNYDPDLPYINNKDELQDKLTLSENNNISNQNGNYAEDENDENEYNNDEFVIDTEKLLWVPANAHPEIAPEKFKAHIQQTVNELTEKLNHRGTLTRSSTLSDRRKKNDASLHKTRSDPSSSVAFQLDQQQKQKRQPSIKALTKELERLSEMAGMPINDAASLARTLSTSSLGYTQLEKDAYNTTNTNGMNNRHAFEDQSSTLKRSRYISYRRGSVKDPVVRRKSLDSSEKSETPIKTRSRKVSEEAHPYQAMRQGPPEAPQPAPELASQAYNQQQQQQQLYPRRAHRPTHPQQSLPPQQYQRRPSGEPIPQGQLQPEFSVQQQQERRHHRRRYPQQYPPPQQSQQPQQQPYPPGAQPSPPPPPPKNNQPYPGPPQPVPQQQRRHQPQYANNRLPGAPQPVPLSQKPQPLLPHQKQQPYPYPQQQYPQQVPPQNQQRAQKPQLRSLRVGSSNELKGRAGAPPSQQAPSPTAVASPKSLQAPLQLQQQQQQPPVPVKKLDESPPVPQKDYVVSKENQENVVPSKISPSSSTAPSPVKAAEVKNDVEQSPTETSKKSKKWQWLKEKTSDKNLNKSYENDNEALVEHETQDHQRSVSTGSSESVNHSRNRHGSFIHLKTDTSPKSSTDPSRDEAQPVVTTLKEKEKDGKKILSNLFRKKDKKQAQEPQQQTREIHLPLQQTPAQAQQQQATPPTSTSSSSISQQSVRADTEISSASADERQLRKKASRASLEDDTLAPAHAQQQQHAVAHQQQHQHQQQQQQQQQQQAQRDETESLKSTLKIEPRQVKPNQPIKYTDSAFGFPLPPASHSTLVMLDYRFPIHVERAIYRLSHLKLANPKRPLRQQVLLSNFMYAYLNLVNHSLYLQQQQMTEAEGEEDEMHDAEEVLGKAQSGADGMTIDEERVISINEPNDYL